ncbi:MAG: hypothetical protein ACTSRG_19595 [Candidatus Helarchaeota archaeon]
MDKKVPIKAIILIILNFSLIMFGYYIFFIFYKPLVASYSYINENDLFFNIHYGISFGFWALSMFCFISTSIKLKTYTGSEEKVPLYYKLIILGFFSEFGAIGLSRVDLSWHWTLSLYSIFLVLLPWFIGFISHYKSITKFLSKRDEIKGKIKEYIENKKIDEEKTAKLLQDIPNVPFKDENKEK